MNYQKNKDLAFRSVFLNDKDTLRNLIVNNEVSVDEKDGSGSSLILHSVVFEKKEIFVLLLTLGADPFLKNKFGESAYSLARKKEKEGKVIFYNTIKLHLDLFFK